MVAKRVQGCVSVRRGSLGLGLGLGLGLAACGTGGGGVGAAGGSSADARTAVDAAAADATGGTPMPPEPDLGQPTPDAAGVVPDSGIIVESDAGDVVTPDAAVVVPDSGVVVESDAGHVVTPDAAVVEPDAAVATPDAAVATPDAAVVPPDAAPPEPDAAPARVITVCPQGCDYPVPSEAARALSGGELVEIQAGDYVDCATWQVSVTLRGVGNGRAHVRDAACGGKGIWTTQGAVTVIENIEFSGMAVPDRNGAGIRHESGRLVVRNVHMHDGEQGILAGANPEGTVLIEDSLFERLGQDGQSHAIYVNEIAELIVRDSLILASQNEGHELKSRALRTVVSCSVIASLDGVDSRNIDLPNGGDVEIRGSIIQQGAATANHEIIGYGLEIDPHPVSRFVLTDSTILNDAGLGAFVHVAGDPMMEVHDNVFVGRGSVQVGGDPFGVNATFPTREAALLPAEPALPEPMCAR